MTLAEPFDPGPIDAGRMPPSACPACAVAPLALRTADKPTKAARLILSLPTVHCAGCMSTVEAGLEALEGVRSARVNLTLRRVSVDADDSVTAEALIPVLAGLGYAAHELDPDLLAATETDRQGRDLLMRLAVAGFSMMNVMLLSVAVWSGATDATRDLFHWISAAIALPTVAFAGQPFFRSAWASLRVGRLGMDVPISLAIILASAISLFETIYSGHHAYFDAAVMLTFFLLGGRYLDHQTRAAARSAARELTALEVPRAMRVEGGVEAQVAISALRVGDLVRVRPGMRMPVDGVVTEGASEIDRSLLTGESLPRFAGVGTAVAAGEMNLTGPILVQVLAAGKDSSLHRMADLVAIAESAKSRYSGLAERAARAYAPLVHLLSFGAFGFWMWQTGGDLRFAINISAAVLIITCPCALGLAVPAVVTAASGRLFRQGLLIKDGTALERLAEVDTVVLDKTGTLTLGTPEALNLADLPPAILAVATTLGRGSSHPLAMSLAAEARKIGVQPVEIDRLHEVPGYGIEGVWQGNLVRLGRAEWVGAVALSDTATYLSIGGQTHAIRFSDTLRPGAEALVAALKADGLRVILLSGDTEGAVARMAGRLGIKEWVSGALPAQKVAHVAALSGAGHRVLMVGDGLNDTGALAAAHVALSPASALDAARVASDIVLLGQDMEPIADAIHTAKRSTRRIRENFALSIGYNLIAVPLALMGLATPLIAALSMSLSSITVSLNALRLR